MSAVRRTVSGVEPYRCWAVDRAGAAVALTEHEHVALMGVSPAVSAGLDLLMDDGMDGEKAAKLLLAAERNGQDAEAFARHMLKLRGALRP